MIFRKCPFSEVESNPNFEALLAEYAAEAAMGGLPEPGKKLDTYRLIETSGFFHIFCAFDGERLVGFIAVIMPVMPHYGVQIAVAESYFVSKAHRMGGAGLKLLHMAEAFAGEQGSPALLVTAPSGGKLAEVLPRVGYRETNRVFMRRLTDG